MTPQKVMYDQILEQLEDGTLMLPTLPEVALRVRDVIDEEHNNAKQLADIISTDAALTARLIKVANSICYRGRMQTTSIQLVIARLGTTVIGNLASCLVIEQMFQSTYPPIDNHLHTLWRLSVETAARSQLLARNTEIEPDEALLAGLVHNIGALPILMSAEQNPEILSDNVELETLIEPIQKILTGAILRKWAFSQNLLLAANHYDDLDWDSNPGPDLVDIVQVAYLQTIEGRSNKAINPDSLNSVKSFQKLGIEPSIQVSELEQNSEEYREALSLFNLKTS